MTVTLSALPFAATPVPMAVAHAVQTGIQPLSERGAFPGCVSFDAKSCAAAALRVVKLASAHSSAPADTPAALRSMAALGRNGALHLATPSSAKPGADGIAVRPNERLLSVQGTINGVAGTLLTAVAQRDNPSAPWRMAYTIGAGAVQLRILQQPIAGQPGRFNTTIGPLDPELDFGGFGPPVTRENTGPLVVQSSSGGRSATAMIDGGAVFPAAFRTR